MLRELRLNNLAIIKNLDLEFNEGLISLTGETGAGKSIILDGISLLIGERSNLEMIRTGEDSLFAEGVFDLSEVQKEKLNKLGFEIEDDGTSFFIRNIDMTPKTEITQYFNKKGELYMISSLTSETDKELYALYRKYDKNGNLSIYTYAIEGKNTDKGYYTDGKLAYILELKLLKGKTPIPNGKYIEYYKNGQVKIQGNHKEGKRDEFIFNRACAYNIIFGFIGRS